MLGDLDLLLLLQTLLRDLNMDLLLGLGHLVDDLLQLTRVQGRVVDGDGFDQLALLEQLGGLGVGDLDDLLLGKLIQ